MPTGWSEEDSRMRWRSIPVKGLATMLPALVLVATAWPAAAQTAQAEPTKQPPPQRKSLIASGDPPDLFLVYTGDVIGYLDPCG